MDRSRPLLAMLICLAIFLVWSSYQARKRREEQDRRQKEAPAQQIPRRGGDRVAGRDGAGDRPAGPAPAPKGAANDTAGGVTAPEATAGVERPRREIRRAEISTDRIRLIFSSARGGGIFEAHLPEFRSSKSPAEKQRPGPGEGQGEDGKRAKADELVLIPPLTSGALLLALDIERMGEVKLPVSLAGETWEMEGPDDSAVTFRNAINENGGTEKGIAITKRVHMVPGVPHVEIEITFENRGAERRVFEYSLVGPVGLPSETLRSPGSDIRVVAAERTAGGPPEVVQKAAASLDPDQPGVADDAVFAALENNYFAAAIAGVAATGDDLPQDAPIEPAPILRHVSAMPIPEPVALTELLATKYGGRSIDQLAPGERAEVLDDVIKTARTTLFVEDVRLDPGASETHRFICYMGPRRNDDLARYEKLALPTLADHGFFVNLFIGILEIFHSIFRNWGIAIVCLTLVVRLALHPLNRKQQAGMMRYQKKIARIQPKINEIKEQYKDDRLKMNQELQKLFKENGVNPAQMMGGCLMMLLQFPIWIGLINTLYLSIDLRQAPFLLWIDDLSQPDRLFHIDHSIWWLPRDINLLPILYVILMLVQQRLNPKAADPQAQQTQRTMSFMMIAFGFIFYGFASGLLLYFLTSAIFGIIESRLIKAKLAREDDSAQGAGGRGGAGGGGGESSSSPALYSSSKLVGKAKKPRKPKAPRL